MWNLKHPSAKPKKAAYSIFKGIANAPFAIAPRVRCLYCGNKVIPEQWASTASASPNYCPCCHTGLPADNYLAIDDIVIPQEIDCEVRLKQLGLIL